MGTRPEISELPPEADQALRAVVDGMCGWTQKYLSHIEASRKQATP